MLKKIYFILLMLCLFTLTAVAKQSPTQPNSYNGMPVSARSIAMGGAGVGAVARPDNVYFDSAGLAYNSSDKLQIEVLASVVRDSSLSKEEIYLADPTDIGLMSIVLMQQFGAISWRTLSSNEIKVSSGNDWYKKQESIKAVTLSVGNKSENGTALGINLSYLYGTLSESSITGSEPFAETSSGNGFSLDVNFSFPIQSYIVLGINLENIAGFMWWNNYDYDQLPFTIKTGVGYYFGGFSLLADFHKRFYRFSDMNQNLVSVGLEQFITSAFAIRLGIQGSSLSNKEDLKYTYGFGLNISIVSLSFAAESYKLNSENVSEYLCSVKVNI